MRIEKPLSVTHPLLAKEAFGWDPSGFSAGSGQRVSWRCSKNHSWEAAIYSRTGKSQSGCPICSNRKVLEGYNDLSTTHPEIAKELLDTNPTTVISGSNKKLKWQCPQGHIYDSSPANRSQHNSGCPICSGNQVLPGFNDLVSTHPNISIEAYGWDPMMVSKGSTKKRQWKCKFGHIWLASPNARTRKTKGTNCPYCSNQKVLEGFNDLSTINSELAAQAYGWDPKSIIAGSSKKANWKCELGHIWEATINSRDRMKLGCPYCSNKRVLSGFNDLATKFPDIGREADGWNPSTILSGSAQHKNWVCSSGHKWKSSVYSRSVRGWGCPFCSNQRLLVGFNDLKTTHPKIASEADGWDTTELTAGSLEKRNWKCPRGHHYLSRVRDRAHRETNCIYCSGKNVLVGFNDLATTHPELAMEACGWDPKTVSSGSSGKKFLWICPLGHTWKSVVANRIRENSGCPYCKNKTLLPGYNDLKTRNPNIASEADGWDPSKVIIGSGKKLKWKCEDGHSWSATVISRTSERASGCPSCAKYGFDPNEKAFLYFVYHPVWHMNQIGITNVLDVRLAKHKRNGWIVIDTRGPMDGYLTKQWETAILRMLRAKGADLANSKIAGKFDGYSEAWSKDKFKAESIRQLMDLTEEYENNRKK